MMLAPNSIHCMDWVDLLSGLEDGSVDLILTDPPYNTTNLAWDKAIDLNLYWEHIKRVLKPSGAVVMTSSQPFTTDLIISNRKWFRYALVWAKNASTGFLDANRRPLKIHEDILVFAPTGKTTYNPQMSIGEPYTASKRQRANHYGKHGQEYILQNNGTRYPSTVLNFDVDRYSTGNTLHPTQKPLALFKYLIQTYTQECALVVDPFSGSGTTAVAAKDTGRLYICGDISADYIETTRRRLSPEFGVSLIASKPVLPLEDLPLFAPKAGKP